MSRPPAPSDAYRLPAAVHILNMAIGGIRSCSIFLDDDPEIRGRIEDANILLAECREAISNRILDGELSRVPR